jgi:hypothetical protein
LNAIEDRIPAHGEIASRLCCGFSPPYNLVVCLPFQKGSPSDLHKKEGMALFGLSMRFLSTNILDDVPSLLEMLSPRKRDAHIKGRCILANMRWFEDPLYQ